MIPERLQRFLRRHGRNSPRMAMMAVARTLYQREAVRWCARPFFAAQRPKQWIFLVGCYNSGTTVTQEVLAAHHQVATLPWEGALITSVLPNPEECGWTRMWLHCQEYMRMPAGYRPDLVDQMLRDWAPWWNRPADVFLEKSITNVTRMAWLDQHLENAYFVGIVRNGYCVAEGICRRTELQPRNARQWGSTYPIEMAGEQWVLANRNLFEGAAQVKRYHQLSYESLLSNPIATLHDIWQFLDLPIPATTWKNGELIVDGIPVSMLSETNMASIKRLTVEQIMKLNPIIGPLQQQLGYETLTGH